MLLEGVLVGAGGPCTVAVLVGPGAVVTLVGPATVCVGPSTVVPGAVETETCVAVVAGPGTANGEGETETCVWTDVWTDVCVCAGGAGALETTVVGCSTVFCETTVVGEGTGTSCCDTIVWSTVAVGLTASWAPAVTV